MPRGQVCSKGPGQGMAGQTYRKEQMKIERFGWLQRGRWTGFEEEGFLLILYIDCRSSSQSPFFFASRALFLFFNYFY